jgi:hypothetical protein
MKESTKSTLHSIAFASIMLLFSWSNLCGQNTIFTEKPVKLSYLISQFKGEVKMKAKEVGFCYAEHKNPTIADSKIVCSQSKVSSTISTIVGQNQLKKGKIYYVRAYSILNANVFYGNEETIQLDNQQYEIGDKAFGGVIVYVFEPNDRFYVKGEIHGMVVAESDLTGKYSWNATVETTSTKTTLAPTPSLGENLGFGKTNTKIITADIRNKIQGLMTSGSVKTIHPAAAEVCSTLIINSFDDWFLPSLKEMELIWFHQTPELNLSTKSVYWTSTSFSLNKAVAFAFKEPPLIKEVNQDQKFAVRPIRYF